MANSANTSSNNAPSWKRSLIRFLWFAFAGGFLALIFFFILVYNGVIGYMPPIEELRNPQDKFASVIYASDGVELGRYFRNSGNRVYADLDEILALPAKERIGRAKYIEESELDVFDEISDELEREMTALTSGERQA